MGKSGLDIALAHAEVLESEVEHLRSEREVQEAALMNLRADLRECAKVRDAEIERLRGLLAVERGCGECWKGESCGSDCRMNDAALASEAPPPATQPEAAACQHDLQEPNCTVRSYGPWTAHCSACGVTFVMRQTAAPPPASDHSAAAVLRTPDDPLSPNYDSEYSVSAREER